MKSDVVHQEVRHADDELGGTGQLLAVRLSSSSNFGITKISISATTPTPIGSTMIGYIMALLSILRSRSAVLEITGETLEHLIHRAGGLTGADQRDVELGKDPGIAEPAPPRDTIPRRPSP